MILRLVFPEIKDYSLQDIDVAEKSSEYHVYLALKQLDCARGRSCWRLG